MNMKRPCTKAVILAAGCGSRVRSITPARPKCLMDLGGRPIIEWIIGGLERAGITEIVVVTGFRAARIRETVGRRGTCAGRPSQRAGGKARIKYVHNPRWRLPNGFSLYAARRAVGADETFLVLMSDHMLPASVVRKVAAARTSKCLLAVDTDPARVFDLSDATKVRIEGRKPLAIGKKLRIYNAVDCGLFRFDRRVFAALGAAFREGEMSLTGGVKRLVAAGDLEVLPMAKDASWIDIDTPKAYRQALRHLRSFTPACNKPGRVQDA